MITQRPFNMHVGIYTKTLRDDLRKGLLITLTLLFVCPGVWGQETWTNISTESELRTIFANGGNAKLTANITGTDQAFVVAAGKTVQLDLAGHTLTVNPGDYYYSRIIEVMSTASLTITDSSGDNSGQITGGNLYPGCGAGIYNSGILIFEGGTITGNNAQLRDHTQGYGGAIYNAASASLTISGGVITNNHAHNAGGIYNDGNMYLRGGRIYSNNNNTANSLSSGIYNTSTATLTISGSPIVENNGYGDIFLQNGMKITIDGELTGEEGRICIMMANYSQGAFTTGLTTDVGNTYTNSNGYKYFKSDDPNLEPYFDDTETTEASFQRHWPVLVKRFALGGTITLDKNYVGTASDECLTVPAGKVLTLNLNGYMLNRGLSGSLAQVNGCVIKNEGTLTITGTGTISGGKISESGGAIINSGSLNIQGGTFNGNRATVNGGAIFNTGTTTITGGSFGSNSAAQGGAIYNNGTLNISAGNISSNTASTNGGGIYHYDGTLNISGNPTISDNHKSSTVNNIYLASGKKINVNGNLSNETPIGVTLAGGIGEFTTELASYTGDYNKFASDDTRFETANATGNEAKLWTFWAKLDAKLADGGTVDLDRDYSAIAEFDNNCLSINKDVTLNLNTFTINRSLATAIAYGYVIKVENGYTLTIEGTGTISGGNNTGNGGGILNEGTLVLSGGSITNNSAAAGGGIYNSGTLQMRDAPIVKSNTGGNIYLPNGHTTITLTGTLNGSDGNIGITMQTPGTFQTPRAFTSGLNTYGTIAKFFSDNAAYAVTLSGDEATLMTHWDALKTAFAAGGDVNLTRNYTAPDGEKLEVTDSKTVTLDLRGYTIDRGLSNASAVANGYVIKVNTGSTLTIKDTGSNGKIKGGNNTGNGGGILNEGTLNIQGGTITNNSAANGGAIYNSGTLTVSGGTIQNNTATTNGGAIFHNGSSFSLQGSPTITNNRVSSTDNNVYLATTKIITISGILNNTNAIGIVSAAEPYVFTTGLSGNGNASKFTSNQAGKGIGLNSAGEAIFGTSYTITRNDNSNSLYLYIKGDWYNPMTAVEGEHVRVRLGQSYGGNVPISLDYTDGTLSTYPEYSTEYTFTMPAHAVTVTGLGKPGGYCGATNQKNIKYYLDGTTLRFIAKDASDYQMADYTQTTVPWRNYDYSTVEIPNNVTHIGNYAFFGSPLATIDIPSTITSIGTFAFANCQNLTTLTVADANTQYQAVDNVLYEESEGNPTNLICYPAGIETLTETQTYTLPSTVTEITDGAFAYNTHLTAIEVAAGSPFTASNGVLYKENVLYCYPARKEGDVYDVASTVTEIKPYAFHNNNLLKAVNFCETTVPTGGTEMFGGSNTAKIMVKKGLKAGNDANHYQGVAYWSNYYSRIYEMDLANAIINLEYDNYVYETFDNPVVKPGVTSVKLTTGNYTQTLRSGIDYVAINDGSYSNNYVVGTATVTITGAGGYDGTSSTKIFTIKRQLIISGASDYYSYYAKENLFAPEGIGTVYTVSGVNWSTGVVTVTNSGLGYLPENVPVLIYKHTFVSGTMNGTYQLTAHAAGTPPTPCEYFKAETEDKTLDGLKALRSASEIYVLRGNNFVRATSGTLKARHCYLWKPIGGGGAGAPAQLSISFDDNTTNIDLQADSTNDSITNSNWYTLDGRKLEGKPAKKGVYIKNGKKVVVK